MPINRNVQTLDEFTIQQLRDFPHATGELSNLLRNIGLAAKRVNVEVNKAGLVDILGDAGSINVQGEKVKKLDVFANDQFIRVLQHGISCAGIASEELDDFVAFTDAKSIHSKYVCLFDPLDGSGNIDVNVSIGTIFGVYRRVTPVGTVVTKEDFLQAGSQQVAAGYIVYGSSTMLVYSTGNGVNGFTLDPSIGEFCLSHPNMMMPETGRLYAMNEGNINICEEGIKEYIETYCQKIHPGTDKPYSGRYIGSLVADFHRNLIKGGIYIYPDTTVDPEGKLRLLYECNPLAFIAEQAGGLATTGRERILSIQPSRLHQRVPFIVGSKKMVEQAMSFLK